jgi:hypothetical protein
MTEDQMRELWYKAGGDIYKYADLVADKEREACAQVCEEQHEYYGHDHVFAKAIRARGEE